MSIFNKVLDDSYVLSEVLPISNKQINYRPMTYGQTRSFHQISVIEDDSLIIENIIKILSQCVSNMDVEELRNLTIFDLDFFFLRLKIASEGNIAKYNWLCGECNKPNTLDFDLNNVYINNNENLNKKSYDIKVNDNLLITLSYPTAKRMQAVYKAINESPEYRDVISEDLGEDGLGSEEHDALIHLYSFIERVFVADGDDHYNFTIGTNTSEVESIIGILDLYNLLNNIPLTANLDDKFQEFYNQLPTLRLDYSVECDNKDCGNSDKGTFEGINSFL